MFPQFLAIVAVPTVVLFQFLQRYIVSGLTAGAVKGVRFSGTSQSPREPNEV
jgi:hypothetical protein